MRYLNAFRRVSGTALLCTVSAFIGHLMAQSYCSTCDNCANYSVVKNPTWSKTCQSTLRLTLVIDESRSIADAGPSAIAAVRNGVLAFLQDLECTPVKVAVVEFSSTARKVIPYHIPVHEARICMQSYFDGFGCYGESYRPDGATNWQAALILAKEITQADLMVFFTDGVPTAWSDNPQNPETSSNTCSSGTTTQPVEIYNAVQAANAIKNQGTRLFALGVGNINVTQIKDVSGTIDFSTNASVPESDYAAVSDFSTLEAAWRKLSENICPLMISCQATQESDVGNVVTIDIADDAVAPFTVRYGLVEISSQIEPVKIQGLGEGRYTFEVYDASPCSREISCDVIVPAFEDEAPIIAECQPLVIDCRANASVPTLLDMPTALTAMQLGASDDHTATEDLTVTYHDSGPIINGCRYAFLRTYQVHDLMGQQASCVQEIEMLYDGEGPAFLDVPIDLTISCRQGLPQWPSVRALDNCSGEVAVEKDEVISETPCGFDVRRTFRAQDHCGNSSEISYTIFIRDETSPRLSSLPDDGVLLCGSSSPPWPYVSAVDDCAGEVPVIRSEEIVRVECGYDIVRTFSAVDACGNVIEDAYVISVRDTESPTLSVPGDLTIGCGDPVPDPEYQVTDNCSEPIVVFVEERIDRGACTYDLLRTWSATDSCGNSVIKSQIIQVIDQQAPVIVPTHPMLQGVESGGMVVHYGCDAPQMTLSDVEVVDDCCSDAIVLDFDEQTLGLNLCGSFDFTRHLRCTYSATDASGNLTRFAFDLIMYDTTPPIIANVPASVSVACEDEVPSSAQVELIDDCPISSAALYFQERSIPNPRDRSLGAIYRTWHAEDACGNVSEAAQMIGLCGLDHALASASIEAWVWNDENHDGIRNQPEPAVSMMPVHLIYLDEMSGIWLVADSARSDDRGLVEFGPLLAGQYRLHYFPPDQLQPTKYQQGTLGEIDSDVLPELSRTTDFGVVADGVVSLAAGFCLLEEPDDTEIEGEESGFIEIRKESGRLNFASGISSVNGASTPATVTFEKALLFPNPVVERAEMLFASNQSGLGRIILVDQWGRLISQQVLGIIIGQNRASIEMNTYPPGLYHVTLKLGGEVLDFRVMKM